MPIENNEAAKPLMSDLLSAQQRRADIQTPEVLKEQKVDALVKTEVTQEPEVVTKLLGKEEGSTIQSKLAS